MSEAALVRCSWAGTDLLSITYHDQEWGVPSHDERHLFEMLTLEGAQSGLSWMTILRKREGYRRAFANFDAPTVAGYTEADVERLMQDASIIRNRLKIESTIANARAIALLLEREDSLSSYLWRFVDGAPLQNAWQELKNAPAETAQSKTISKELKREGFRFLGPTTCYAFMQATGMVNDHVTSCYRYAECAASAVTGNK